MGGGYQLGSTTVWLADDTGGHRKKLWTFSGLSTSLPAWNPAGNEVALAAAPQVGEDYSCSVPSIPHSVRTGLWVVNTSGGHTRLVAPAACGPVTWAPDGKELAYFVPGDRPRIETIAAGGGTPRLLYRFPRPLGSDDSTPGVGSLSWAPDGRSLLVDVPDPGQPQLIRLSVDGGPAVDLATAPAGTVDWGAVYSPTGTQLAVLQGPPRPQAPSQLVLTDLGGQPIRTLGSGAAEYGRALLQWTLQPANVRQAVTAPTTSTTSTTEPHAGTTPTTAQRPPSAPPPSGPVAPSS